MSARKCRRTCAPPVPELPVCLMLEIAARAGAATIFRFAATCKLLRREMLSAEFWAQRAPDRAAGHLERYGLLTSRNGLVVMCRSASTDLCVYDPKTSSRAFLSFAPDIGWDPVHGLGGVLLIDRCALLTAADGIGCSFMLLAADMARNQDCASSARVRVQTVSSSDSEAGAGSGWGWGPVKTSDRHPCPRWCTNRDTRTDAAVVVGGVVHWLMHCGMSSSPSLQETVGEYILTYDVKAATVGSVDLPKDRRQPDLQKEPALPSRLESSPDGKLRFVVMDHKAVFVWVLSGLGSRARQVQIGKVPDRGLRLRPCMNSRVKLAFWLACMKPF